MEQAVEHVLKQLRATSVALCEPLGVALEPARRLARQIVQTVDVALGPRVGLEHDREGVEFVLVGPAVSLGQLGPEGRDSGREGGVLSREAGRTVGAFGVIDATRRKACYGAPETHGIDLQLMIVART